MKPRRYVAFYILFALVAIMISARLVNLQIVNGNYYREKSDSRTIRSIELVAPRGEILDRNGRAIVSNRTAYNVYILSNRQRTDERLNKTVYNLYRTVPTASSNVISIIPIEEKNSGYSFTVSGEEAKKWKTDNGFKAEDSAKKVMEEFIKRYEIKTDDYSKTDCIYIAATRLNMVKRGFSATSPYLFAEDVPIGDIAIIKEQADSFPDVSIITQPVRDYPYGSFAAHILGRVGVVSATEYEENKNNGYNINSQIGKSGIEKLMESYLRGENGGGSIQQSSDGRSIGQNVEKAPITGRNVSLTIDLDMQLACEKALEETILNISTSAAGSKEGKDADAGSIVVIDVNTGDILAIASYPSYEIKTFTSEYNNLLNNKANPLFNRALAGTYAPASTFKPLVGIASLEEEIITYDEEILDTGKYTYFKDYQPGCWIYNQTGGTHGYINVAEAIRDSCNVFFFDVGRRLGINKIDSYAAKFGFGQNSGIELSGEEKTGVVASPENRKKSGGIWYPGDVCQTSIGQSDTLVTPIQLANYMATLANGGTRYRPRLIKAVENVSGGLLKESEPEVLAKIDMSKENQDAILSGLRMVVTEGTAERAFDGCSVSVAAKTGSAQISGNYTNGICIAYAPYDKPRIAIACVVEKAGSGANVAQAVRMVVDDYFKSDEENDIKTNVLTR